MNTSSPIRERTQREREAHTVDDVLAKSRALKDRFPHIPNSPAMRRCEGVFAMELDHVQDLSVLDYGCGSGVESIRLLDKGARVVGIDISDVYVESARRAAEEHSPGSTRWAFHVMDAHKLEFEDATFDRIVGRGILHHLDLRTALGEIRRVLKPGGRALFLEPLGSNPLLKLFRMLTPAARTVDEKPLDSSDLRRIAAEWQCDSTYYGLLSAPVAMVTSILWRPYPDNLLLRLMDRWEQALNRFTLCQALNQYVLLNLVRR